MFQFYVAEFDFDADDPENQLSLTEGQLVAVHAKHDQDGKRRVVAGRGRYWRRRCTSPPGYLAPYS